jgi:hypothetical protein
LTNAGVAFAHAAVRDCRASSAEVSLA